LLKKTYVAIEEKKIYNKNQDKKFFYFKVQSETFYFIKFDLIQ